MRLVALALVSACLAMAGEYAVLASGFRLYAERHEEVGDLVRLHLKDGSIELPTGQIRGFEAEEYVPPPPPPAPAASAPVQPQQDPAELIEQAALRNGLPPEFVHSVAKVESGLRPDAVSLKGAVGVMQLMPSTAKELGADPRNVEQNVEAGAKYLRDLLLKYQDDPYQVRKALAGYNAGPAAVDRYNGIPPYPETRRYVERVLRLYQRNKR